VVATNVHRGTNNSWQIDVTALGASDADNANLNVT
jgi:hypothetical protein